MPSKPQLAVGLDVGSSRVRCVICALEGENLRYLGHGLAVSSGWNKGRIVDQDAVAESLRAAVTDAERQAKVQVDCATLGIGGMHIEGSQSRGHYDFGRPTEISQDDLTFSAEQAAKVRLEPDRMLLHVLPQDFTLDGRSGFRKPHRGVCARLEAHVHVVTASIQEHQSLIAAAHLAHLPVEETVFEPLAAAYACLFPEDRSRGVAVVDIGAHSTGLVIYNGEAIQLASSVPVWGERFTRDIASVFKITTEDAECLKQEYGCALLGLTSDSSLIEVPSAEGRRPREARRGELIEILEARAEELFQFVQAEIRRSGMDRNLFEGIVLTGGGSLMQGICDMAERVLNCPAGNGLAKGIADWPEELGSPLWTTAAGLAMYSAKLKQYRPPARKAGGLLGLVMR
jgi:cell division protein FtsA